MTEPSWSQAQRDRLAALLEQQAADPLHTWIGYWNSDAWGRSANGGDTSIERAAPGVIHVCGGPLELCSSRALHATWHPHRWRGVRVWVVALHGERHTQGDKCGALKREIIGEVLPEDVIDPSVAARMWIWANLSGADLSGADLSRADLSRAYLSGANLYGADLSGANLSRAYLSGANLYGANLSGANLYGANLYGADLSRANLSRADLSGAYLSRADLSGANLYGANLSGANLYGANLSGVDLSGADLSGAYLSRADLSGADLSGANLSGAYRGSEPLPGLPEQYDIRDGYVCRRKV